MWPPHTITFDGYAASHRAVREMRDDGLLPERIKLRSSKYLNKLIEQDHRGIKSRIRPMLGFKSFASAAKAIAGIELLRRIHKRQFALSHFHVCTRAALISPKSLALPLFQSSRQPCAGRPALVGIDLPTSLRCVYFGDLGCQPTL
jgi:DDE domain